MLFESYLVFLTLEIVVLILAYLLYWHQPKSTVKQIYNPWGFWNGNT